MMSPHKTRKCRLGTSAVTDVVGRDPLFPSCRHPRPLVSSSSWMQDARGVSGLQTPPPSEAGGQTLSRSRPLWGRRAFPAGAPAGPSALWLWLGHRLSSSPHCAEYCWVSALSARGTQKGEWG